MSLLTICLSVCVFSFGKTRQEDQKQFFNFVWPYLVIALSDDICTHKVQSYGLPDILGYNHTCAVPQSISRF